MESMLVYDTISYKIYLYKESFRLTLYTKDQIITLKQVMCKKHSPYKNKLFFPSIHQEAKFA